MNKVKVIFVFLIFTSLCFALSISDYENRISEWTLSNGMHFIILEDHTAPVVSFVVCVDAGSVDEKEGETGISHLIEHLAFNGTEMTGTKNWEKEKKLLEQLDKVYEEMLSLSTPAVSYTPHSFCPSPLSSPLRGEGQGEGAPLFPSPLKGEGQGEGAPLFPSPLKGEGQGEGDWGERGLSKPLMGKDSGREKKIKLLQEKFNKIKEKAAILGEPNEFGKIFEKNGAVGPNAYTSNDITVYWVELPSNKTELWALLESDRLFNPVFRSFYEELEVVKEERRMRAENSPWGKLMEEFHRTAFTVHPYRNPVVGYKEDLEMMTRRKVRDFYKRYYVPSNITIVLAGDITKEEIAPLIERYFGKIPSYKKQERNIPAEPPLEEIKRVSIKIDSEPIFITGFHIPDINHPDIYPLDICAEVLGAGRTSRLYKKLVKEEKIATSVGAWCRSSKYPSLFYIWAIPSQGRTNREVEEAIIEVVEKIKKEDPTQEELEGAKARLSMEVITELKDRRGLAEQLGIYHLLTGDWRNLFRYIEKIEKITTEDVKKVMEKYIRTERRVVGTVEKEGHPSP